MKLFCKHEWVSKELLGYYYDYHDHFVGNYLCECSKCGKEREIRYVMDNPFVNDIGMDE